MGGPDDEARLVRQQEHNQAGGLLRPTAPKLEELRDSWFEAPGDAARKSITEEMQRVAMDELPVLPLGGAFVTTAHNRNLVDRIVALPLFWGIRRT